MIPKKLHYCWFGGNPLNEMAKRCIESWKKYCPDYEIIEWNEQNYDVNCNAFVKEAYENKKWAFVSDYVRLDVLERFGGVYLDADVEILKNLDPLLVMGGVVTGYQQDITIPAALMAAETHNEWIKIQLKYYDNRHFVKQDGSLDMVTNSIIITMRSCQKCGFRIGDDRIETGNVVLLPTIYLAPIKKIRKLKTKETVIDVYDIDAEKTYAIHHAVGSWTPKTKKEEIKKLIFSLARLLLTERVYTRIKGKIMRKRMGIK